MRSRDRWMNRRRRRSSRSTESGVRDDARARDEGPHRRPKSRAERVAVASRFCDARTPRRIVAVAIAFWRKSASSGAIDEDTTPASIDRAVDRSIARSSRGRSTRWFRARSIARAKARKAPGRDARMATTATTRAWEDLRKDARRTESAIERELGELSALGARATRRDATIRRRARFARDATIRRRDATRRDATRWRERAIDERRR